MIQASSVKQYAAAIGAIILATVLRWMLDPILGDLQPFVTFFVAAPIVAWWCGTGPALLALVLGWWCGQFFFLSPRQTLFVGPTGPQGPHVIASTAYFLLASSAIYLSRTVFVFRDRASAALAQAKKTDEQTARLAAIVAYSEDAIISKDLQGIITSWNASAQRIFGYTPEEAIGKSITMLIPEDHINEEPAILSRIRRGESVNHYETVRRRKDGTLVDISLTVSPIRNSAGEVIGASKIVRDISSSKLAEVALRESEKQARAALTEAEAASRTKDEFLAMLSHELRTPMTAILGWAHMLRSGAGPEETAEGIEVIERNARLQAQIIEDLLDMSRIVSGKFRLDVQTVNVSKLVVAAVNAIRLAAEAKDVKLTTVCDSVLGEIRGDPNRLQQVFFNLLSNATKFTPRGGTIQVTCQRIASHVEVTVSDTGIGIKPEFLPHVFDRFRQQDSKTTRQYQGLGLGLAIVKHLVELHGGTVQVASEGVGKGSTFTVQLPISIALTPSPSPVWGESREHPTLEKWPAAASTVRDLAGLTVLVTDDEPDARELIKRMLERRGATVLVCGSALDALDRLQRHRPNVLICDIGMPGIDGYSFIGRVRSIPPERGGATPAIALTAFARSEDRTRSLLAGYQLHLSKPVEPEELVASIRRVAEVA